ncbi:MAG: replicative DNA helicase [Proteobacteria bacterium]|nr:replicative DNA helicase [Pseudomonadota bacterium]
MLGNLMLNSESWDLISDSLSANDFYRPAHQVLFQTIHDLHRKSNVVDLVTVTEALKATGQLDAVGGMEQIASLVNTVVTAVNIKAYASIVREKAVLRKAIQASSDLIEKAFENDFADVDSFIAEAEAKFLKLSEDRDTGGLTSPMEIVANSMKKIDALSRNRADVTGVPTGFADLDRMTSGLHGGELIILAARPSMGKTALSLNIAQNAALRHKKTVAYFSCEMSQESVMMRILSSEARINMKDVRTGKVPDSAWTKLITVAGEIGESKLFIDETSGISPHEVRARCRRLKAKEGLDLIVIDYLQLMSLKQRVESREREVSEISKTLKTLAKEMDVPVIALAQLNRGVEGRTEKRPMLSDLRESGSIEQDADVIMMLYRDDYYDKDDAEKAGRAEVIIGKQRNGPTGTVNLKFEAEFNRFRDADRIHQHPLPPPQPTPINTNPGKPKNFAPGASV